METSNVAWELSLGITFICLDFLFGLLLYLQGKRKMGKFLFKEFKKMTRFLAYCSLLNRNYFLLVKISFLWLIYNLGIHNSPLDGSDIQAKTSEEQDPRKDEEN